MARDGIADLTWVNPGYEAGRFPVFAAGEMKDAMLCFAHVHTGTLHSKQAIPDAAQIQGMKIRPSNGTMAACMTLLGATNVQVSAPSSSRPSRRRPGATRPSRCTRSGSSRRTRPSTTARRRSTRCATN